MLRIGAVGPKLHPEPDNLVWKTGFWAQVRCRIFGLWRFGARPPGPAPGYRGQARDIPGASGQMAAIGFRPPLTAGRAVTAEKTLNTSRNTTNLKSAITSDSVTP